jgi:protein-L-isoaspartate(D-aspartate) O-methyltransferase
MSLQILIVSILLLPPTGHLTAADPYVADRERMVREQIENRGITNPAVVRVMLATPRHLFVPPNVRYAAYADHPLPIGYGATISQPYIVALMTDLLQPAKHHRVLEIGTGSGYQAAVLAKLVKWVYTIEIVPILAASARTTLGRLGYSNITVRQRDGYRGWPEEAPFDRIIVTAAPLKLPEALVDQLATGGRLVAPVGPEHNQELMVVEKGADGTVRHWHHGAVNFVIMKSAINQPPRYPAAAIHIFGACGEVSH